MTPALSVTPGDVQLDSPAGYELGLNVPQDSEPYGLATPDVRSLSVTLPEGTSLSPTMLAGVQVCTSAESHGGDCPSASAVGTAEITSPLLSSPLTGAIYIGAPTSAGPPSSYPIFVRVSAQNVTVDLPGQVEASEQTGQVTAVFEELPELPFSALKLDLDGGPAALLANPATCGPAIGTAQLYADSGQIAQVSSEPFTVADEGSACPPIAPFTPGFIAGSTSPRAGRSSPFTATVTRADGQQSLEAIDVQLPPGLVGMVKSVPRCPELQAADGACLQASEIGTATVAVGAGPLPLYLTGPMYLTGPFRGAPFGLSIVLSADVGPFDLGTEALRASIAVSPSDAHLSIESAPLPQILAGVPLRLRAVSLDIDRSGFLLNPTDCSQLAVSGALTSTEGTVEEVSSPFQLTGCRELPFAPTLSATSAANSSKASGASLQVRIASSPGQVNLAKVKVDLPRQLAARLSSLQQACRASVFHASPAFCPRASIVGMGTVLTTALGSALTGPVYLVAKAGDAFPDLVVVLRGEGVAVELVGQTDIEHGVVSAAFNSVPDIPIGSFDLALPEGPHSLLAASTNLCNATLTMPVGFAGHDDAVLRTVTTVTVEGCRKAKRKSVRRRRQPAGR